MKWTKEKPTAPGWYWCANHGDTPGELWEAVVRVERTSRGLECCWFHSFGAVSTMREREWSPACFWAGPIPPPILAGEGREPTLRDACEAVPLFHSGGPWDDEKRRKWKELTGQDEATTKVLCDTVRRALAVS